MSRNEKIAAYIGFSIKSRNVLYGYESVIASGRKCRLILCDRALSENSLKKVDAFAAKMGIKRYCIEALSDYFGGKPVKCIGLVEEHLASATENELLRNSEVGTDE